MHVNKLSEARENTSDQDALDVSFASDWLTERRFFPLDQSQSERKPSWGSSAFDT